MSVRQAINQCENAFVLACVTRTFFMLGKLTGFGTESFIAVAMVRPLVCGLIARIEGGWSVASTGETYRNRYRGIESAEFRDGHRRFRRPGDACLLPRRLSFPRLKTYLVSCDVFPTSPSAPSAHRAVPVPVPAAAAATATEHDRCRERPRGETLRQTSHTKRSYHAWRPFPAGISTRNTCYPPGG